MDTGEEWLKEGSLEKFWKGVNQEDEDGKTSKFMDAGGYNRNEGDGN
jgi:hypothetical protein